MLLAPSILLRWLGGLVLLLFLAVGLNACTVAAGPVPAEMPTPTETLTPAPTGTPTATVVWFPPTATFTPFPTQEITPTVDARPQAGEMILSDDFSDPQRWALGRTTSTSIALGKGELTLALSQPGGYLYTLHQGMVLSDFYLEVTASANLCKGSDEYGLLLRVSESLEFFRFALTCDGQVRLDKYFNGRASSPQPLTPSGEVPRGAPGESRLGVWAHGKEMRFYVNGEFQFSVHDPSLLSGGIGLFARSEGDNAVTVSFSELEVRQILK